MAAGFKSFRFYLATITTDGQWMMLPIIAPAATAKAGVAGTLDKTWYSRLPRFYLGKLTGTGTLFTLDTPEFGCRVQSKAKAGVAGTLTMVTAMGFPSSIRPWLTVASGASLTPIALGSVSVGALAKAAPTGETLPTDVFSIDLPLEVFSKAKGGVVATGIVHDGPVAFPIGALAVGAKAKGGVAANFANYAFSIGSVSVGALAKSGLTGDVFQPIIFNIGPLFLDALGKSGITAVAVGQPAQADFENLPFGSYGVATTLTIWNMALSHIGVKRFVQSETERSQEVSVLTLQWAPAVNFVLADHPWSFARKYASLGLVTTAPNDDWGYAYRHPADCVFARRLVTATGGRSDPTPPPFILGQDNWGRLIFTDVEDAVLEYTMRVFEPERYDPQFVVMISWYLAHLIANPLSRIGGASEKCYEMYRNLKSIASATSMNERQQDDNQEAEWILART